MIGGLTRIIRDVPPFTLVNGNPAEVRGLNQVGLQRAGLTEDPRRPVLPGAETGLPAGLSLWGVNYRRHRQDGAI